MAFFCRPTISVLSAFEESSAACISDMLRQVSNGQYLDAIRMAEKFILHVEVLFGAIDDLEHHFASNGLKGKRVPWAPISGWGAHLPLCL